MMFVSLLKTEIIFICISVYLIGDGAAQCGTCLPLSSTACISETQFKVCINNIPQDAVKPCPTNQTCTNSVVGCELNGPAACSPAPAVCGRCGTNRKFACLDEKTYAFCYGTDTVSPNTGSCPADLVCSNSQPPAYCVDPTEVPADCKATTPKPPPSLCTTPGNFPFPGGTDCKQYVKCYYSNNVLRAQIYYCQGNTIFYPPMQLCTTGVPCIT